MNATNEAAAAPGARERILLAAHDLFYREGIRATGIDRVIAESGVAKLSFYRHYPSKNDLVLAFLDHRHARWMAWFEEALARHGGTPQALVPALREWFGNGDFRGCAFINSVGELGESVPEINEITRRHKADMAKAIARLLPAGSGSPSAYRQRRLLATDLATAVDGAIIRAQYDGVPQPALASLKRICRALLAKA
jgi:AcrR family transcriptional regulator